MKLNVHVGDSELFESGNDKAKELLIDKKNIIRTKEDIARILSNFGGISSRDVHEPDLIPENPTIQDALRIIYHASNSKNNPSMSGKFNGQRYKNPRDMLKAAQDYLAESYGGDFSISGEFAGTERKEWDKINTPYGEFTNGKWNRKETNADYGEVNVEDQGIHLGDAVEYNGEKAVVVNASHKHHGLQEGTARIEIRFEDGSTEKVVPRALRKIDPKKPGKAA